MSLADSRVARRGDLIALIETAAVRNSPKRARLELRVVEVADAGKELILLAEVEVNPHVKLVQFSRRTALAV